LHIPPTFRIFIIYPLPHYTNSSSLFYLIILYRRFSLFLLKVDGIYFSDGTGVWIEGSDDPGAVGSEITPQADRAQPGGCPGVRGWGGDRPGHREKKGRDTLSLARATRRPPPQYPGGVVTGLPPALALTPRRHLRPVRRFTFHSSNVYYRRPRHIVCFTKPAPRTTHSDTSEHPLPPHLNEKKREWKQIKQPNKKRKGVKTKKRNKRKESERNKPEARNKKKKKRTEARREKREKTEERRGVRAARKRRAGREKTRRFPGKAAGPYQTYAERRALSSPLVPGKGKGHGTPWGEKGATALLSH